MPSKEIDYNDFTKSTKMNKVNKEKENNESFSVIQSKIEFLSIVDALDSKKVNFGDNLHHLWFFLVAK